MYVQKESLKTADTKIWERGNIVNILGSRLFQMNKAIADVFKCMAVKKKAMESYYAVNW